MSINRGYVANHKIWDRMGRITPNMSWSESHRPHMEATVAPWLPVQRYEKELENYIVVSAGKVVAEDREGFLAPAGLRKAFNVATSSTVLTYTATDVTEKVLDLTTGALVTGATSYTEAEVTAALKERGLIRSTERATDFISKPVGVAPYNYYKASGPDHYNPATLYQHNFRPQAITPILCDWAVTYPVLPAKATTETMDGALSNGATDLSTNGFGVGGWFGSTAIHGMQRYDAAVAAGDNVVCYICEKYPLAHITAETPMTGSVSGLTREVSSISDISAAGDYFVDHEVGAIFFYEADGDAIPSPWSTSATLTYYHYEDAVAASDSRVSTYVCATGDLDYGDFLTYDAASNLVKAQLDISAAEGYVTAAGGALYSVDPEYDSETDNAVVSRQLELAIDNHLQGIVGQVIGVVEHPRDYLDRVRTSYEGQSTVNLQTPGSATGGRTDQLTYSGGAERMVIVNLIMR